MNLCYLYSKSLSYPYIEELLNAFDDSTNIDIDTIDSVDEYDVYIVELNDVNKEISLKLVNIFKKNKISLIYCIVPKNYTLLLFQLTYLLNTKSIITHNQNIDKLITKINADRDAFSQHNFENWLGNVKIKTQKFIIYKNKNLVFVNKLVLTLFECDNETLFKTDILSKIDINRLLKNDTVISEDILNNLDVSKRYTFKSVSASNNDKIIYIEQDKYKQKKLDFISSKISFIEFLKENILQRNIFYKDLSILTINIDVKKLLNNYNIVELEDILLDLLTFIESNLENKLIFSQFENDFYMILFEDVDFEQINSIAEHFYSKVLNYIDSTDKKIMVDLFTFNLKTQEFSEILTILNKISHEDFKQNHTHSTYMKYLTSKDCQVDPSTLLYDVYKNKNKIKILNIYNGLVVNTSSKIIKITEEYIYITFESLQGVILNLEKETVLQSDSFSQDIHAEIKQISLSKKIAILENFKFLKTNANAREYARVTTSINIPIAINHDGKTVNGAILDISIKSIAVRVKHLPKKEMIELRNYYLVFNILDKKSDNGYIQLNIESKVIMVTGIDKTGHYKVICDLNQESDDLNIISEYVYDRQKELIIELKKMSKLN